MRTVIHCDDRQLKFISDDGKTEYVKIPKVKDNEAEKEFKSKLGKIKLTTHRINKTAFIRIKLDKSEVFCMGIFGDVEKVFPILKKYK